MPAVPAVVDDTLAWTLMKASARMDRSVDRHDEHESPHPGSALPDDGAMTMMV